MLTDRELFRQFEEAFDGCSGVSTRGTLPSMPPTRAAGAMKTQPIANRVLPSSSLRSSLSSFSSHVCSRICVWNSGALCNSHSEPLIYFERSKAGILSIAAFMAFGDTSP